MTPIDEWSAGFYRCDQCGALYHHAVDLAEHREGGCPADEMVKDLLEPMKSDWFMAKEISRQSYWFKALVLAVWWAADPENRARLLRAWPNLEEEAVYLSASISQKDKEEWYA
jgi:hypothetical protein